MAGAAAMALLGAAPAAAADARPVQVAAGPLDAALSSLAAQTGEQLLYTPDLVAGRQAPAVSGRHTTESALRRLLGDDIEVARAGPRSLVLRRRGSAPLPAAAGTDGRPFVADAAGGDPSPAPSAAAPATAPGAEPVTLDTVEVIGTHIRGQAPIASPLLVIDRDELERSGHGTVAAALAVLPQNFAGTTSEGAMATSVDRTGANVNYGTGLNLRGLGSDATLTLVNGRRMGGAGAKGDFADISTIPSAAVARVEVLLDGASALYGSDAVGGVVNIVLRRDFDGAETQLLGGIGTAGEPWEARASQIVGRRWSGGGAWATYELHHRAALPAAARRFATSADLRRLGGSDWRVNAARPGTILALDPTTGATVPGWAIPAGQDGTALRPSDFLAGRGNLGDQREGAEVLPEQTRHSILAFAHQRIGDRLELEAEARWGYRRYAVAAGYPSAILTVNRNNPFFVSPNGSASHQIAYAFAGEAPIAQPQGSAESLGLTLGATLDLPGDWQARGHAAFAQEIGENRNRGAINSTFLAEALGGVDRPETPFSARRDGYLNPYIGMGTQAPAVLAFITQGFTHNRTRDRLATVGLQADGAIVRLPGGPLKIALGGQLRREAFLRRGSSFSSGLAPTPIQAVDARRLVSAVFGEARIPIVGDDNARPGLRRLELSLAGRYEHYDDVGASADPKVGLLWSPAEGLSFRGTWGTSFRAPGLRQTRDLEVYSPSFLPLAGAGTVLSLIQQGGNPDLQPETARSWSLGVDLAPEGSGLRLSASLFDTRFEDRIDQPARVALATVLADPALAPFVQRIRPTASAADLALIEGLLASPALSTTGGVFPAAAFGAIVDARYVNTAAVHVRGIDLTGSYAREAWGGELRLAGNLSWLLDFEQRATPSSPEAERAGLAGFPSRLRARASADWQRGAHGLNLAVNHSDASRSLQGRPIRAQTTFDLQARWTPPDEGPMAGLSLVASVRNLFDRDPPFHDSEFGIGYDPANGDPIGRYVSLQLTKRW